MSDFREFRGGRTLMLGGAVVGLVGVLATTAAILLGDGRAAFSYLVAFAYWVSLALGSLLWLLVFHATGAKWMVVLRRVLETNASTIGFFVLLFVPIALGLKHLYMWVAPPAGLTKEAVHLLHNKAGYLNTPAFIVRTVFYFVVWGLVSQLLFGWSTRQDAFRDIELTRRQRGLGAIALPVTAVTLTFAAWDWLMSLEPLWASTIFGVYYFAGGFLGAMALLTLITVNATGGELHGHVVNRAHLHSMGKFLLAFVIFWAYIGFSQLLLIYIANLPHEVQWYLRRTEGGWGGLALVLLFGHFVVPFVILLSRDIKMRPRALAGLSVWLLVMHYIDLYWVVLPITDPAPTFHWTDPVAFLGVGGLAVAFALFRLRGHPPVPVNDPYLEYSLRYVQP